MKGEDVVIALEELMEGMEMVLQGGRPVRCIVGAD